MWFEDLVGFEEVSLENVRDKISIEGNKLISKVNGKSFQYGTLEIPTLKELKDKSPLENYKGRISIIEIVGNVQEMHCDPQNRNALFQAASQFNLLEMVGPHITPESGVGIYEKDYTQGPACAIACGAGTIYRNYFVPIKNQVGQSSTNQIDCLDLIGKELGNDELFLWKMTNGYALVNQDGLLNINAQINNLKQEQRDRLKEKLKIGIQWNTEVTIKNSNQLVSQAYCSALPVAYSNVDSIYWSSFAKLILEATYEATLHAALINFENTGCNKVFLTLVGGGAFGNEIEWIIDSLSKALSKFKNTPLEIGIISYGSSNYNVRELIKGISL
ncbi:hypothetical protein [Marinigracilibium pacificum]|uniref:Uncharacterized protein n=1 Tax=Marinigracilibium pacificum TaxID=2729599 RepID=A0A848J6C1_9BACT|nr:hypothetical protein [Marinigracilibium pacificum]NMM50788.1 hypothetical protein [Marinigracilibium pacificum]